MKSKMSRFFVLPFALLATMSSLCSAQWTTRSLHPAGATYSQAGSISGNQVGGTVRFGGLDRAALWNGLTSNDYADLHPTLFQGLIPPSDSLSSISDVAGGRQVGVASELLNGSSVWFRPMVWSGTNSSWFDPGAPLTFFHGTDGTDHVGYKTGVLAVLWLGALSNYVDLHNPLAGDWSIAYDTANGVQVGVSGFSEDMTRFASLWQSSSGSWVNLHPDGASVSEIYATDGTQHVGMVDVGRAALWIGASNAWINLSPDVGYESAQAYGVRHGLQVGRATTYDSENHAALWKGSAASFEDLHQYLPPEYTHSYAHDVDVIDGKAVVVGWAYNAVLDRIEAVVWIQANQPPVAVAGADQTVFADSGPNSPDYGTAAFGLDGNGSYDPDGDQLTYEWSDANGVISNDPWVGQTRTVGTYEFTLKVTDPDGLSDSDTVTITVEFENRPPIANAGPDQTVTVPHDGSPITAWADISFDGTGSYDPDGDSLYFEWFVRGSRVAVGPASFVQRQPAGSHVYTLRVTDPFGNWSEDQVVITVLPEPNQLPIVNAGPDMVLYCPKGYNRVWFSLKASATDPDNDSVIVSWHPLVVENPLNSFRHVGTHVFTAYAKDPYGTVVSDVMVLTVLPAPTGNPPGPRPEDDEVEVVEGGSAFVDLLANDWHSNGEPIYYLGGGLENGSWGPWLGEGKVMITPPSYQPPGTYSILYVIRDDQGRTAVARLKLKIKKK